MRKTFLFIFFLAASLFLQAKTEKSPLINYNCDDGNGLPPGFVLDEQTSLGLKIIKTMVEADLRGTFTIEALKHGTCAVVTIPSELEGSE